MAGAARVLGMALAGAGLACLAGCGGSTDTAANSTVTAQAPTSYTIRKADLNRPDPNDICRSRDADFLPNLTARVTRALPPSIGAPFAFEDFSVTDGHDGKGREAVLRFRAAGELRYAIGDFDAGSCAITKIRAGVGPSPYSNPGQREIRVPD